jgi:hypothetical protein
MACEKRGYPSFRLAQEVINKAKHPRGTFKKFRQRKDKIPLRSYRCPECGQWHLTSHKEKYKK